MLRFKIVIFVLLVSIVQNSFAGFFDERYRGWIYYELPKILTDNKDKSQDKDDSNRITPEQAKQEIEELSKELEDRKYILLARPTPENIKKYRVVLEKLFNKGEKIYSAWEMANFLYPEQVDYINNPSNVFAVKEKRAELQEQKQQAIKQFAGQVTLVFFFSPDCRYSQNFTPVLKNFVETYGFEIEAVSNDGSQHPMFKTVDAKELLSTLGITAFPTVIAVGKDTAHAIEFVRGFRTLDELEDISVLAKKHFDDIEAGAKQYAY